jgi:hypothetical protein
MLRDLYSNQNVTSTMYLSSKLHAITLEEGILMSKLIHKTKEVTSQMAGLGEHLDDTRIVQLMLNVLPNSHKRFIQYVISQNKMPMVTKLTNNLLYEEQ